MAKKKRRRRQQGVVSWITSAIAVAIGLSGVVEAIKVGGLQGLVNRASFGYTRTGTFQLHDGLRIYAPMLGAILFKKLASQLVKTARIQSLIPRLG